MISYGCYLIARCFWLDFAYGVAAGNLSPQVEVAWKFADFAYGRDTVLDRVRELELSAEKR